MAAGVAPAAFGLTLLYAAIALPALGSAPPSYLLQSLCLAAPLVAMSVIDGRSYRLPNWLTLPLLVAGLARVAVLTPPELPWHALAAACGYGFLAAVAFAYRRLRGHEGLGLGDAKLMGAAGAWLGLEGLLPTLLLASTAALAFVLAVTLKTRTLSAQTKIALGPFIALGIWITWLYGALI